MKFTKLFYTYKLALLLVLVSAISMAPCEAINERGGSSSSDVSDLVVRKATPADLETLAASAKEIGRFESHAAKDVNSDPNNPFGIYVIQAQGEVVGIQSFSPSSVDVHLFAEATTDILSRFAGKGYGKYLRTETAKLFQPFMGRTGLWQDHPELPLTAIYSCNEWNWGANHPSLSTCISAGYGILCITPGMGLAQMFFPSNESCWNRERTEHLLTASRLLMRAFSEAKPLENPRERKTAFYCVSTTLSELEGESIVQSFMALLEDFNFEEAPDVYSGLALAGFLMRNLEGQYGARNRLKDYFRGLGREKVQSLIDLTSGKTSLLAGNSPHLKMSFEYFNLSYYECNYPSVVELLKEV